MSWAKTCARSPMLGYAEGRRPPETIPGLLALHREIARLEVDAPADMARPSIVDHILEGEPWPDDLADAVKDRRNGRDRDLR